MSKYYNNIISNVNEVYDSIETVERCKKHLKWVLDNKSSELEGEEIDMIYETLNSIVK